LAKAYKRVEELSRLDDLTGLHGGLKVAENLRQKVEQH